MRTLALLALATLVALPLSAHDHWRDRRPVVVVEEPCRPHYQRWEARHWDDRRDDRWDRRGCDRGYYRHDGCDEDRVVLRPLMRPLAPPFFGRMELRIR